MFERVEKNNNVDRALINRERVEIVAVFFIGCWKEMWVK